MVLLLVVLVVGSSVHEPAVAQGVTLGAGSSGVGIGNTPRTNGLRINFRDRGLEYVNGVNLTIWSPHNPVRGDVAGVSLGLPASGANRIMGLSIGAAGIGAEESITGVGFGGLGLGAGKRMTGVFFGGLGVGAGEDVFGIAIGGLGAGGGQNARGVFIGGLGAGAGHNAGGIFFGGLGAGAGQDLQGLVAPDSVQVRARTSSALLSVGSAREPVRT